jgi:hypothetical protein
MEQKMLRNMMLFIVSGPGQNILGQISQMKGFEMMLFALARGSQYNMMDVWLP